MSSAVWMVKPFLSCQVTAHQPSLQLLASTTLPAGMSTTTSLVVAGPERRLTFESTYAGVAATDVADSTNNAPAHSASRPSFMKIPPSSEFRPQNARLNQRAILTSSSGVGAVRAHLSHDQLSGSSRRAVRIALVAVDQEQRQAAFQQQHDLARTLFGAVGVATGTFADEPA